MFSDLVVSFRQRLMHLPGAVKMTLGLTVAQALGLQKEIRAALTDLSKGGGALRREAEERATKGQKARFGEP